MSDNGIEEKIITKQEKDSTSTTKKTSVKVQNPDGTTTITDTITTTKHFNKIKMDPNAQIQSYKVEATSEDKRYVNALYLKNEVAIIEDNNNLICIIPLNSLKKIFKLFDETIEMSFDRVSYGIYSIEEIIQFKQMIHYHNFNKIEDIKKDFQLKNDNAKKFKRGSLNDNQLNNVLEFYENMKKDNKDKLNKNEIDKKKREDELRLKVKNQLEILKKKKENEDNNNDITNEDKLIISKADEEKIKMKLRIEEENRKKEEEKKSVELKKKKDEDEKNLILLEEQIKNKPEEEKKEENEIEEKKEKENEKEEEKEEENENEENEKIIMTSALPSGLNSIDFSNRASMKNNNNIIDQGRSTLESAMQIHTNKSGIPLPVEQKKKNVKVNIVVSNIEPDFESYDLDVDNNNDNDKNKNKSKSKDKSKDKKNVKNQQKKKNLTPSKIKKDKSPDSNINNNNLNQNENQESKKQKKKVIKKVIKKVPKQNNQNTINNLIPYSSTSEIPKQINTEIPKNNNQHNINQTLNKPLKNKNITNNNNNKVCMICKGFPVRPQECVNCKRQICTICTYELNKIGICNECGGRIEPINKGINNNNNIRFESNITKFQPKSNIIGERNKYNDLNAKEFYEKNKDRFMNDTWKDDNYNTGNFNTNVNSENLGKNNLMFECEICGKKYNNENDKLNHINSEHDNNNLSNFNFKKLNKNKKNRKENRQQSVGSINIYECKYCDKSFGNKITRAAHIKNIHGEDYEDDNINKNKDEINKKRNELSFDDKNNNGKKRKRYGSWSEKYPCDICDKEFDTLNSLDNHIKNTHNQKLNDKNYLKNLNDIDNVNDNNSKKNIIEKYNNIDFYPCDYCSQVYNDLKQLKQHINDIHGKEFDNDKYLNNIKKIKSGEITEQYPCENCNKIFNNLNTLIQHNNNEHNININKDEYLNNLNSNKDDKNIKNSKYGLHNIYPCEYCNKVYNNFNTLSNHIKNEHGKLNIPKNSSTNQIIIGPNEFYCRFCLKNFPSLIQRDNHILSIHNITPYDEDKYTPLHYSKDIDINSNSNYFCRHCNKIFPSKNERDSHLKNNHLINENVINENVQYIVEKKPKEIIDEDELFYNNRRRYDLECKYCLRPFNSLNNLYQHMYEMHHIPINKNEENLPSNLEKEYECKHCNKKFSSLNSINQHLKTTHHINDILNENEIQKSNHIKYLTKDLKDYFYCNICGQVFNYRPNLINHLKEIHNIYKTNNNNSKISYKSDDEGNYDSIKKNLNENELDNKYKGINYSNGKYECNYCKKSYLNNEKCENHIKRHHYYPDYHSQNPTTIMQGIKQKKGQYECDFCNKIYNYYNDCVKHIYRHHLNENNKIEEIPKNLIKGCIINNGKFECNYCNKIYIHYNDCEKHITKHHLNNDNNIYGNTNNYSGNSNFSRVKRSDIYNCFFCKQILKSKTLYLNHLQDYHKIEFDDNYHLYDSCDKTSYRIQNEFLK